MRSTILLALALTLPLTACDGMAQADSENSAEVTTERNKRLAREFYENLWFTNNTDVYADYVADEYLIHDIGDKPGAEIVESGITQKEIADRFHGLGNMTGVIDYQIAEGDKVATRWFISMVPNSEMAAAGFPPVEDVPIINVFRFNDEGKITEIWNHRHDVSLPPPPGDRGQRGE